MFLRVAAVNFRTEKSNVPFVIVNCVNEVERRGIKEVGIYRVSGSASDVQKLRKGFENSMFLLLIILVLSSPIYPERGVEEEILFRRVGQGPTFKDFRLKWFSAEHLTFIEMKSLATPWLDGYLIEAGKLEGFS